MRMILGKTERSHQMMHYTRLPRSSPSYIAAANVVFTEGYLQKQSKSFDFKILPTPTPEKFKLFRCARMP